MKYYGLIMASSIKNLIITKNYSKILNVSKFVLNNTLSGYNYNNLSLYIIPFDQFDNLCLNSYEDYKNYINLLNLSNNFDYT